ncbi:MAG: hypothetical protein KC646_04765 [Candidatus Cloacimonetes bacterium]|nr:hypothetical protein [Candidatus Cloacimonadota bacterium]
MKDLRFYLFTLCWLVFCLCAISYQNAFFVRLIPSFYLPSYPVSEPLDSQQFENFKQNCFNEFKRLFDFDQYQKLSDSDLLKHATITSQEQLKQFNINLNSKLTKIKYLSGVPRILGLSYGGIAYHDLFTGEIVIPTKEDYPTTLFFRAVMIFHEIGHAFYHADDVQNSIFQAHAMISSKHPVIQSLGYLFILQYTDYPMWTQIETYHPKLYNEMVTQQRLNMELRSKRKAIKSFKRILTKVKIQNNDVKYGYDNFYLNNVYLRSIIDKVDDNLKRKEVVQHDK